MTLVVDASVACKWFFPEPGTAEAREVLATAGTLIAPDLIVAEVANVAWKRERSDDITLRHAREALRGLARTIDHLVPMSELAESAVALAAALDHPAYDCLYLALAVRERAPLVTDDGRFLARLQASRWKRLALPLR